MIGKIGLLLAMMLVIAANAQNSFQDSLQQLNDEKAKVRMTAAWDLGKSGDARAVDPLIKHLDDKDEDVRAWVVLALANLGQPAIDPLIEALKDDSCTIRWQASAALGLIGDARAAQPLLARGLAGLGWETRPTSTPRSN